MWEERMKMILNEYRLLPFQKEAQEIIAKQMEEFFFGEGGTAPAGIRAETLRTQNSRSLPRRVEP